MIEQESPQNFRKLWGWTADAYGFLQSGNNRQKLIESSDFKNLSNVIGHFAKNERAIFSFEHFGGFDHDAQTSAGDIIEFFAIDDKANGFFFDQLRDLAVEFSGRVGIQSPMQRKDAYIVLSGLSDFHMASL